MTAATTKLMLCTLITTQTNSNSFFNTPLRDELEKNSIIPKRPWPEADALAEARRKRNAAQESVQNLQQRLSSLLANRLDKADKLDKLNPKKKAQKNAVAASRSKLTVDDEDASACSIGGIALINASRQPRTRGEEHPFHAALRRCVGNRPTLAAVRVFATRRANVTKRLQDEVYAGAGAWLPARTSSKSSSDCGGPVDSLASIVRCVQALHSSRDDCPSDALTPLRMRVEAATPMEFGYEAYQGAPDVYALCRQGILSLDSVCRGSGPLYFYAGAAVQSARRIACDRNAGDAYQQDFHRQHRQPPGAFWERHPPFAQAFKVAFGGQRVAFVFNKRAGVGTFENEHGVPNSWSIEGLEALMERLLPCYDRVVYFRSSAPAAGLSAHASGDAANDGYGDIPLLRRRFPSVLLLHELIGRGDDQLDALNAAQLVLAASAHVTIGVQGGGAVLAALAATNLLLLCRRGYECDTDVGFWSKFNNATIIVSSSEQSLITLSTSGCSAGGGGAARIDALQFHHQVRAKSEAVAKAAMAMVEYNRAELRRTTTELFNALVQRQRGEAGWSTELPSLEMEAKVLRDQAKAATVATTKRQQGQQKWNKLLEQIRKAKKGNATIIPPEEATAAAAGQTARQAALRQSHKAPTGNVTFVPAAPRRQRAETQDEKPGKGAGKARAKAEKAAARSDAIVWARLPNPSNLVSAKPARVNWLRLRTWPPAVVVPFGVIFGFAWAFCMIYLALLFYYRFDTKEVWQVIREFMTDVVDMWTACVQAYCGVSGTWRRGEHRDESLLSEGETGRLSDQQRNDESQAVARALLGGGEGGEQTQVQQGGSMPVEAHVESTPSMRVGGVFH